MEPKTINHTITKDILLAAKIATKDKKRSPILQSVYIDDEKIVATDSYKLIEIMRVNEELVDDFPVIDGVKPEQSISGGIMINAKSLIDNQKFFRSRHLNILNHGVFCNRDKNRISIATTCLDSNQINEYRIEDGNFPDYKFVIPKKINSSLKVSRKFLIELLSAFDEQHIEICFANHGEKTGEVLFIKTDNKKGVLMPLREND